MSALELERQGAFFVGGRFARAAAGTVMTGQMFVQFQTPHAARPYPIVLMHGWWQTGAVWLGAYDGRPGWSDAFLRQRYSVYVVDLPGRGRSAFHPEFDGPGSSLPLEAARAAFVDTHVPGDEEGSARHTQWADTSDAAIAEFYASHVPSSTNDEWLEESGAAAGIALLERIGPCILLTHSGSGPLGWLIADRRPELVKAIVAIEPAGPPFADVLGPKAGIVRRPYGLTSTPLSFEPPAPLIEKGEQYRYPTDAHSPWPDGQERRLQKVKQPVLMVMGEASYHTAYDRLTADFLRRSGARLDFLALSDRGISGNGHMMMLEANSDEIAGLICGWLNNLNL